MSLSKLLDLTHRYFVIYIVNKSPAIVALNRFAKVPAAIAFHPNLAMSPFLLGAIPPIPPINRKSIAILYFLHFSVKQIYKIGR